MKPKVKFLHTADLHLGARFIGLGKQGSKQRQRLREVLLEIVDLACREHVDAVLLAGDTLDSNTPSPESLAVLKRALNALAAARIPVLVIGGTHDGWDEQGIWVRLCTEWPETFFLFGPQQTVWQHPRLPLTIYGVSLLAAGLPRRPLSMIQTGPSETWQIGMIHAALDRPEAESREAVVTTDEIAASHLDYLALGHWHTPRDCSSAGCCCWYAGAPEIVAMDQAEPGSVLMVTLEAGHPPLVEPRRTGKRSRLMVQVDLEKPAFGLEQLQQEADPDRILEVTLHGMVSPENKPDIDEWLHALADRFFHVRIRDHTTLDCPPEMRDHYPENTILGRFVRLIEAEKTQATEERKKELDHALQLGLALMTGREVTLWS